MKREVATYIIKLDEAARNTKRAEDRAIYQRQLASAAVILALAETGAATERVREEALAHERLRGNSWPVDEAHRGPAAAWQRVMGTL